MQTTPHTLLEHLRQPACGPEHWGRFVDLYSPLLFEWARRSDVPSADAPDLVQNVLVTLIRRLPAFERQSGSNFRGWLWTELKNCWADDLRVRARQPAIAVAANPDHHEIPDPIVELSETEYRQYLTRRLVRVLERDFPERTWRAFWAHVVESRPAVEVAAELETSANAVYLARGRVLQRLREELAALAD
ncbi:MAG TPA: sigma-70 family RNA polymerase sigma factor [Gemmataceae bacterium]|nr:sigma-70 family RNA polymerase sigma factor [Gemmataceae bacterium]